MTPTVADLSAIMVRLEKLESQNRRFKQAGCTVFAIAGAIILMGQARPVPQTVVARKFVLQDSQGRERAQLSVQFDGPALEFADTSGRIRAELRQSSFTLLGPNGIPPLPMIRLGLGDARNPGSTVGIIDVGANVGLSTVGGEAFVTVGDQQGHTARVRSMRIEIVGKDRKPIWQAPEKTQ